MTAHRCVFCPAEFARIERLVEHVVGTHRSVQVPLHAKLTRTFYTQRYYGCIYVYCFCGERFSCNRESTPLFSDWAPTLGEPNSWTAHLRREGGLEKHLERVRDAALFDRIADCCGEGR